MQTTRMRALVAIAIVVGVLCCDQLIKLWVKMNMCLYESIHVADWFYIYFTENKGMAFGMDFIGTMFLSVFRIVVVSAFVWLLVKVVRGRYPMGLLVCVALLVAGASGNIIDNCFYGLIFDESTPVEVAHLVSAGDGYGGFLTGHVVDMFYFPLIDSYWPEWVPVVGGEHFVFFSAIFNFADAAISCAAVALLIFYPKYLVGKKED
ncbi:lipoprotein signal peptidase [Prevotella sp. CAG:755]|nr:lipoprotein signal peptidase [Prevotella sp. CAG:755]